MLVILGSTALNYHFYAREPVDLDILGTYDDVMSYVNKIKKTEKLQACYPTDSGKKYLIKTDKRIIEAEIAWPNSISEELFKIISHDIQFVEKLENGIIAMIPSLDVLYMLKMSHRYKKDSPHFLKTMNDIILMDTAKIPMEHYQWYLRREKETYTNTLPKLNRSKAEFFDGDGIVYEWDHDSIHEAVKIGELPAYTYFSGGEVWSDMKKFMTIPREIRLLAVLEESLVLGAERSQLCFPNVDPRWSFEYALSKVCTSITGGVFREFAYDNYYTVIEMYDTIGQDYMDKVRAGINSGVVKCLR